MLGSTTSRCMELALLIAERQKFKYYIKNFNFLIDPLFMYCDLNLLRLSSLLHITYNSYANLDWEKIATWSYISCLVLITLNYLCLRKGDVIKVNAWWWGKGCILNNFGKASDKCRNKAHLLTDSVFVFSLTLLVFSLGSKSTNFRNLMIISNMKASGWILYHLLTCRH